MRQKKEKIKICVVSYFIYPLFNKKSHIPFGGAEVQLYLLLKEFSKEKKYDLNVITSDLISKKKCEIHDNIKVHVSIPYKKKTY